MRQHKAVLLFVAVAIVCSACVTEPEPIEPAIAAARAEATVAAVKLEQRRAEADFARAQSDAEFIQAAWRVSLAVALPVLAVLLVRLGSGLVAAAIARRSVLESRSGTLSLYGDRAEIIHAPAAEPVVVDFERATEAASAPAAEPLSEIVVHHGRRVELLQREDGEAEQLRRHALRLLRESMVRLGPDADRLLGWRDMPRMSAETWSAAVHALGELVTVKRGRGGGVRLSGARTLYSVYSELGERRLQIVSSRNN